MFVRDKKNFPNDDNESEGLEDILTLFKDENTYKSNGIFDQRLKDEKKFTEVDDLLFNLSDEVEEVQNKEPIKHQNIEEEEKDNINSTSSILKMLSSSQLINKTSTQKTSSNSDVAKLLSDFLSPSEELYRIHIHASYNNTIITLTNSKKNVLITTSGGRAGFKKAQRGGYEAAHQAAVSLVDKTKEKNINVRNVEVLINGFGPGRDAAFKAIASTENPWDIKRITDSTPLPFDGCRPRKARRL
ncbi:10462_t:CDS:2 [Diversispora eburnea]|uniref:10462_t:CDS:1 n=1 Tax=Diversispora eburnea TaxID=1213867 RepID=A0A9N9C3M5_9GLOM|nr:10462_t:CDS:2 [Diversispora eburnea]